MPKINCLGIELNLISHKCPQLYLFKKTNRFLKSKVNQIPPPSTPKEEEEPNSIRGSSLPFPEGLQARNYENL